MRMASDANQISLEGVREVGSSWALSQRFCGWKIMGALKSFWP